MSLPISPWVEVASTTCYKVEKIIITPQVRISSTLDIVQLKRVSKVVKKDLKILRYPTNSGNSLAITKFLSHSR